MTIPKLVHICWFGNGAMSPKIQKCIASINALKNENYTIQTWNETNYDVRKSDILYKAYNARKWSLVTNYVRLDVLRSHGGIYLDTDVEVVRNFDPFLENDLFLGFMWDCTLGTAVIGASPNQAIIAGIIDQYERDPSTYISPNNNTFTDYFIENVGGFKLNGRTQTIGPILIADKYTFEQPSLMKKRNTTIHHFEQSWKPKNKVKSLAKSTIIRTCSLWLYRKYVCWNSLRKSPYYQRFLKSTAEQH